VNERLVPGESCPRRRHTSPALAPCTPHRLKPSRRGPSRLILHPQRTRDPWSGPPGGGPCEAFMPAERILRALPSCWSGALWGGPCGSSVAAYRVVERPRTRCRPCLAGAPHSRSATCGRGPDDGAFTPGRTAGSRPDRIMLAASQPTTDQADPPAVSPADPVADSPSTLRIGDPPMGILAAQGGSPAKSMSATHWR
jgi:hypothetical protein